MLTSEQIASVVSKRFREVREWRGMKRWQAAVRLRIFTETLKLMEKGEKVVTIDMLFRAAGVYRVEADVLLGRKNIPRNGGGKRIRTKAPLAGFTAAPAK